MNYENKAININKVNMLNFAPMTKHEGEQHPTQIDLLPLLPKDYVPIQETEEGKI